MEESNIPPAIQELIELLEAKYGKGAVKYAHLDGPEDIKKFLTDKLGLEQEPTQNQIHWVRENRSWLAKRTHGVCSASHILQHAEEHARAFAKFKLMGLVCDCGDPRCGFDTILAKFPKS